MKLNQCRFLMILTAALLLSARDARPGAILTYTGDPNSLAAYGDYQDLSGTVNIPESQIFQSFVVPAGTTWTVSSMFINETDLGPSNVTEATWSIRTGMSSGNGGTVLFSGSGAASESAGSISQVTVAGLNVTLPAGLYWMNITPETNGTKMLEDATSGANSVNATLSKSGLWYENNLENYAPVSMDFSMGISGNAEVAATPEPASFVMMSAALLGFALFWKLRGAAALKPSAIAVPAAQSNPDWRR